MTTIFGISNIKDVAILNYKGGVAFVNAKDFLDAISDGGERTIDEGNNPDISCGGWETRPQRAHGISAYGQDNYLTKKTYFGTAYSYKDGASHDDDNKYNGCSRFWNLYSDDKLTAEKKNLYDIYKFKKFSSNNRDKHNWLASDRDGRYSYSHARKFQEYWRLYYRTWDDFLSRCSGNYSEGECFNGLIEYVPKCSNKDDRFGTNCSNVCNAGFTNSTIVDNCNTGLINYSSYCSSKDNRYSNNCNFTCDPKWSNDTLRSNCNTGIVNYSDNCRSGVNRYSDNCKYTCDPKWTDSTLRENCNFGVSQDCNDYDHYKDSNNFTTCEASLANTNYAYPYTKLKDYCINEDNLHNDSICTNYQKNNDIYNRLKNDMNDICDLSKNPNNYSRCKTIIKRIDSLGDKFINWCKDNSSNEKCVDMLTSTDMSSLRDRYNNKLINDICSTGDKIITDSRCKNLLDSDNINIKNKAEDVLASYCNNNSKTFTLDPLVDNSCYRIANYKCSDTTLTDADKIKCNSYYTGILSKLETTTDVNNNVLYIFYDDNTFKRMPINYKFKSDISLTDADNPISLTTANKKTLIDIWTAKVFAFIQPDITGSYTFQVIGDDGVRFNINDKQLINNYPGYLGTQTTNAITLNKDLKYLFYFEFYENYGAAALNIKYKMNATDSFKDIPLTWYRPFKFNKTPDTLKNIFLNYMIAYPQNYFTDTNYKKKIDLINTDVIKSISDYCNVDYQKKDITTNCVKYVRNPMTYIRDNPNFDITKNDTSVSDANCTAWTVRGDCDTNPEYMLNMCPKACAAANNNNIYNKLFLDRLQNSVGILESSNYTNVYSSDYILLELIPYLKKIYSNDLSKVYKYLKDNKIITPKLIYTAEINNNYTTNLFINKIYNMFKDIPDNTETSIANSYKGISINNCIDIKNIADSKCDSIRNDNSNYAVFTQPMYLYCNANENMNTDFCQTYYNNYNDKVSDINVQNKCATLSAFENDKNVIINNIELESFTDMPEKSVESDHNSNTLLLIFIIIISIIFAGLLFTKVGIEYRNYKKNKNRQIQKFMFS